LLTNCKADIAFRIALELTDKIEDLRQLFLELMPLFNRFEMADQVLEGIGARFRLIVSTS